MTAWKKEDELSFLKVPSIIALQQKLMDLDKAYKKFFKKETGSPKFKKKGGSDSFRFPCHFKVDEDDSRIYMPKIGWVRYRKSRNIEGQPKNITVSLSVGKWYVSIQTEREVGEPVHPSNRAVGIDMGITRFATLSDGTFLEPLNSFKKKQKKLTKLQRRMSKKKKFSQNWKKAKQRIQRLHKKISDARKDYLHKASTTISKNHAVIVIEDLKVSNMSHSASGTLDSPGKSVRAKSGLNRAILDQGWAEFRRQLEYKQLWMGGNVIAVPPQYTSQRCSKCGHTDRENRKTQAGFVCTACGFKANADHNAALNILAAGLAVSACGVEKALASTVKQEPTYGSAS